MTHTSPVRESSTAGEDLESQNYDVVFPHDGQAAALLQVSGEMTRVHRTGERCEHDAEVLSSAQFPPEGRGVDL